MKDFRDLFIKVDSAHTAEFVAGIDAVLHSGWQRAPTEEEHARRTSGERELFYYICDKRGSREAALVAIYRRDAETLYVSNVVPREIGQLEYEQYNAILADFHDNILSGIKVPFSVTFLLASDELHIENLMSIDAFKQLKAFSAAANKSTGSSHPRDRERWFSFLVTLHREKHRLDVGSLKRWLVEVEGWSEDTSHKLAVQFEFAMGLLGSAGAP